MRKTSKTRKTRKNVKKSENHTKSPLLVYIEAGFAGFIIFFENSLKIILTMKTMFMAVFCFVLSTKLNENRQSVNSNS